MMMDGAPNSVDMIEVLIVGCSDVMTRYLELGMVIKHCDRVEGTQCERYLHRYYNNYK